MARFSAVILAYFVIGAVMWGGGAIQWEDSGVGELIITDAGDGDPNEQTANDLENLNGPLQTAAATVGGPILAIWNFIVRFFGYLFWPITVLQSVSAPPRVTVLVGGSFTVMFLGAAIRLIRRSA